MKKNWLFALLCCVCAVAVSCSDDDDPVNNDPDASTEAAPTILVSTSAGSDNFTISLTTSSDASQYGYVASTSALTVSAEQIIAGSVSNVTSAAVYNTSDGTFRTVVVNAAEGTTYYVYAAAVTAGGTYSTVASSSVTIAGNSDDPVDTDTDPELNYAFAYYYGDDYTDGTTVEYYVYLSETDLYNYGYQVGEEYFMLSLRSTTEPTDYDSITIPAGTYTVSSTDANNVIYMSESVYGIFESTDGSANYFSTLAYITGGSVTVSVSGSTTTIEGSLTDGNGASHNISFSGEVEIYDVRVADYSSTLTEDKTVDLTGAAANAYYYGDAMESGTAYWEITIYNTAYTEGFQLAFCADPSFTAEAGIPTGTYTGEYTTTEGTYLTGILYNGYAYYSWFFTINNGYIDTPYSPFGSGTITVTKNEDGTYTIDVDVMDDSETYSIKGTWTGTPSITDYSSSTSTSSLDSRSERPGANKFAMPLAIPAFSKETIRKF